MLRRFALASRGADAAFHELVAGSDPLTVDGSAIGHELPARALPARRAQAAAAQRGNAVRTHGTLLLPNCCGAPVAVTSAG